MNTTLVSLVAEAGPEEQAVASGGEESLASAQKAVTEPNALQFSTCSEV